MTKSWRCSCHNSVRTNNVTALIVCERCCIPMELIESDDHPFSSHDRDAQVMWAMRGGGE